MTMTLREALEIQAKHVEHYGKYHADLAAAVASMTDISGCDLNAELDVIEVNKRVPRGSQIEWLCGIKNND